VTEFALHFQANLPQLHFQIPIGAMRHAAPGRALSLAVRLMTGREEWP